MSLYDIIMLVVFAGAILFGYWKGLAWQIASVAAIVASYFVSMYFREPVSRFISAEEPWNRIAAMLILFVGTSILIWSIYASISKSIKKMEMKGFDRQAGAILGAAKGALLCMVITMFSVSLLGENAHDTIHNSRLGRYVVTGITKVSAIVPAEIAQYVQPHVDNFNEAIGHDGNLPLDQYPQYDQYPSEQQTVQDPNQVPRYPGQWQLPQIQAPVNNTGGQNGYANQTNPPTNTPAANNGFKWNWGTNQNSAQPNSQQTGYQQNGTPNSGAPPVNNGWPDVNFQVNSKELFDRAANAATEAARSAFETPRQ
jgi:membrane protein required for colicin V production